MTTRYLLLVLVEVPDYVERTKYHHWFNCVSFESASVKNGLLKIVFSDGDIQVFNEDETDDIVSGFSEIIQRTIWKENPIPGSTLDNLFDED